MTVGQYCNRHVITTLKSTEIDEVARNVGLSRPHFFALFKEQMSAQDD